MKSGLHCLPATDQQSSSGTPSFSGQLHTLFVLSPKCYRTAPIVVLLAGARGSWRGRAVLRAGQARACRVPPFPRAASGLAEGRTPIRTEETPGMGSGALANVFTSSGTERPLPGYGASLLHQQIVSIPSLQELPRAPRKRDAETEPRPRLFQSLEGPHSSSDPEL